MGWRQRVAAILGVSAYEPPRGYGPSLDSPVVEDARRSMGGMIQPVPSTQLRWYLEDLEFAQAEADAGNLARASQLYRAMRRDGVLMGILSTMTSGLVRLPKRFYGPSAIVDQLRSLNGSRSVFDEMCPPSELAAMAADLDTMGVCVGELVPVRGRRYPVLVRLDTEWLQWVWAESRWYYLSRAGRIPITPGDGRWVLGTKGGRISPWQWGNWAALGRAFIMKEHAISLRGAFISGIANPAKVMQSPSGATEAQRKQIFRHVVNWGPNMALELPTGFEMKILEVMGRAWQTFQQEIDTCDMAYMIAIAGQILTTTGGAGFANGDVGRMIQADKLKALGEQLAYTVNTQILPAYIYDHFGDAAVDAGTGVEWDTAQPKDLETGARTLATLAGATESLKEQYPNLDTEELATRYSVPQLGARRPVLELVDDPEGELDSTETAAE
jgi:hypothetical protein